MAEAMLLTWQQKEDAIKPQVVPGAAPQAGGVVRGKPATRSAEYVGKNTAQAYISN